MSSGPDRAGKIASVVRVSSGNFLEMYDFFVFGYYASAIGKAFFPSSSEFAQLMLAFMTFGAGFLMRPLGAIVLGAYIDHHGRRAGLLLTLGLMAIGTLSIALVPGYATIGLLAPMIVVVGPADPGILGRRRARRRLGLSLRDRDAGPQGLLCQLAIRQPADRGDVRGAARRLAQHHHSAGRDDRRGAGAFRSSSAA